MVLLKFQGVSDGPGILVNCNHFTATICSRDCEIDVRLKLSACTQHKTSIAAMTKKIHIQFVRAGIYRFHHLPKHHRVMTMIRSIGVEASLERC
jgi:ethanolamine utilization protein EutP (predicted NTPase)